MGGQSPLRRWPSAHCLATSLVSCLVLLTLVGLVSGWHFGHGVHVCVKPSAGDGGGGIEICCCCCCCVEVDVSAIAGELGGGGERGGGMGGGDGSGGGGNGVGGLQTVSTRTVSPGTHRSMLESQRQIAPRLEPFDCQCNSHESGSSSVNE